MIVSRLTMRALVERDQAIDTDAWGNSGVPNFQPLATLPCFIYSNAAREAVDDEKTAMVEDMRALFALDADITEHDEISSVTNRLGIEIIPGRLQVEGPVQHKHTHQEAALRRIS